MEAKMMIAGSFDEFVEKIAQAERKALAVSLIMTRCCTMIFATHEINSLSGDAG